MIMIVTMIMNIYSVYSITQLRESRWSLRCLVYCSTRGEGACPPWAPPAASRYFTCKLYIVIIIIIIDVCVVLLFCMCVCVCVCVCPLCRYAQSLEPSQQLLMFIREHNILYIPALICDPKHILAVKVPSLCSIFFFPLFFFFLFYFPPIFYYYSLYK